MRLGFQFDRPEAFGLLAMYAVCAVKQALVRTAW